MNKLIIISIFLTFGSLAFGQKFHVSVNAGYATYYLSDLKDYQIDLASSSPSNEESLEKFPNNLFYNFTTDLNINKKNLLGIGASYYTSGARNQIADYSGKYKLDMIVNGYAFTANYKTLLKSITDVNIYFQVKAGIILSSLNINRVLEIYNINSLNSEDKFKGTSFIFEPGIFMSYSAYKSVSLNLNLGFEGSFNSKLYNNDDISQELEYNGENIRINWSGIRISIGVSYSLSGKEKK